MTVALTRYPIEYGIPIPPIDRSAVGRLPGRATRPWDDMPIGASFFVRGGDPMREYACASEAGKRKGKRFTVRSIPGGVRVWREA